MCKNICIKVVFTIITFWVANISSAQWYQNSHNQSKSDFQWPEGKKMGLSLSFDDARLSVVDIGIPLFDRYGVKATFYLSPGAITQRLDGWKKAVSNGHDIGNHSVLHPCTGNYFSRESALEGYTLNRMYVELDSANMIIKNLLGVVPVSFGYPCGQKFVGRGTKTERVEG